MNVNVTVETKADVKVYVTTGGSDALESNWTLPPLVEAVEDGHGDVRGRREGRDAESASPRSEPTRGRTICDGEEPRASERTAGRHCADSRRTRRCTRWGSGRRRPRRSRGRREEGAAGRDSPVRESRHGRLDATPGGAADGDGHGEVVAAERREPRDATPPCVRVAMGDSTLPPVGQRTETATEKSWPPRGGSRGTRLPRA